MNENIDIDELKYYNKLKFEDIKDIKKLMMIN